MKKKYLILILVIILLTGCKRKTYTVTFIDDDIELSRIEVKKGDNIKNISDPTKEGYIFLNWLKDGIDFDMTTPINEDITLVASWTEEPDLPNNHTVTFNFGEYMKKMTVKDGDTVMIPKETPKKDKYIFLGWYDGDTLYNFDTPVTKDIIITAKFEKNRVIINYDLNGGTNSTIEVEIEKGTIPKKPRNPERFGYTFSNWLIGDKVYNFDVPIYEDTTIKANYTPNIYYKVSFDTDGGNLIPSQMLIAGEKLKEIPTPVKEGYIFKYWQYDDKEFDASIAIDKDITLLAIYEESE